MLNSSMDFGCPSEGEKDETVEGSPSPAIMECANDTHARVQAGRKSRDALSSEQPQISRFFDVVNPAPSQRRCPRTASD